jgi:ADP-heptose:LPS heptosyltransferase
LRPSFGAFPRHHGFLKPDAARAKSLAARLGARGAEKVIGISWTSSNREFGDRKSTALADWIEVLRVPGVRFINLQYGDTARERNELRKRHGHEIGHLDDIDLYRDLESLAALCAACDLVITVSNVTAHMAGALGRPVWQLTPKGLGRLWYWFSGREDSPWYPSMRIFNQRTLGNWQDVLGRVALELAGFVGR